MSLKSYMEHYLDWSRASIFLYVSFIGLIVILTILLLSVRFSGKKKGLENEEEAIRLPEQKGEIRDHRKRRRKKGPRVHPAMVMIERFYELTFSCTSILFFISGYYLIDRFVTTGIFRKIWDTYGDFLLLEAVILSVFLNLFLDHVFVWLKDIKEEDKSSMRLVAMIYLILIFAYIKFIYEDNNYDALIMYFLTMMIGRFVYFDASFHDFWVTIKNAFRNVPILFLVLLYSALMCYVGFKTKFLLTSNGVIVSVLIAHLFMDIAIFVIHHLHVVQFILKKREEKIKQ